MTIKHLYPTQRPSLDLNFARTKRLDPRVDFERFSVGTYVGNDGLIKTAVDHEPRFDHDPLTGESLGLLVEESSTNLFDYSVDVSQWTGANWTATPNSITAPDGTLTGGKVVPIVGTTFQTIGRSITWTSGVTYSVSFFAKDAGMGGVQVQCFGQINRGKFDLVNGTSSIVTTGLSTSITPFPNGWYKCVYIFTAGSASTGNAGLRVPSGFTPDGVNGIYAWGFQVEALAFPTSYIPTDGTPGGIARAADVASITGTNFTNFFNNQEGTLFFQYQLTPSNSTIPNRMLVAFADSIGWYGDVIGMWGSGTSRYIETVGYNVPGTGWSSASYTPSSMSKYAIAYQVGTSTSNFAFNGALQGARNTTARTFNGLFMGGGPKNYISRITYYPTRLTDSQLQELTR